jgi:hypothetical protein
MYTKYAVYTGGVYCVYSAIPRYKPRLSANFVISHSEIWFLFGLPCRVKPGRLEIKLHSHQSSVPKCFGLSISLLSSPKFRLDNFEETSLAAIFE